MNDVATIEMEMGTLQIALKRLRKAFELQKQALEQQPFNQTFLKFAQIHLENIDEISIRLADSDLCEWVKRQRAILERLGQANHQSRQLYRLLKVWIGESSASELIQMGKRAMAAMRFGWK